MSYNFTNLRVLIVEDSAPMLALLRSLLNAFGIQNIYGAADGERGFRMVKDKDPDLIITDWMMEPIDGIQFSKMVRNENDIPNPFVPIIMMTGFSSKMRVMEARDQGVTEFLVKPFSAYELYRRISQVIEKPRQFVKAEEFFGPDRRRQRSPDYTGPLRRGDDMSDDPGEEDTPEMKKARDVIRDIRKKTNITSIGDGKDRASK